MCKLYFDAICENQILMLAKSLNGKHSYPLYFSFMITVHIMHLYVNCIICE